MTQMVRDVIGRRKLLPIAIETLSDTDDLYDAGLTSFATVQLMLALEESFDVEFPEAMLTRRTFASIDSIHRSVSQLLVGRA